MKKGVFVNELKNFIDDMLERLKGYVQNPVFLFILLDGGRDWLVVCH